MQYKQIPSDTFQKLQLNAGVLLSSFTPASGSFQTSDILGATTGGVNFSAVPEFKDMADGIDNAPSNMLELKKLAKWEAKMSGTFKTVDSTLIKMILGAADSDSVDTTKIIPRADLASTDFKTVWWVGDYSDKNTGTTAGFLAIKLMNALSTGGFQIQSTDDDSGQFAFEFTGHYSMNEQDTVPFEIYVKQGT